MFDDERPVEPSEDLFDDEVLVVEREEAEGVELFDDPDAVVPASALKEGSPGDETLQGDGSVPDEEDRQEAEVEESYDT